MRAYKHTVATSTQQQVMHGLLGVLQRRRGSRADPITEDDVLRAMDKLKVLGGGFDVVAASLPASPDPSCPSCLRAGSK